MWPEGGCRLRGARSGPEGESLLFGISTDLLRIRASQRASKWAPTCSPCSVGPPPGAVPGRPGEYRECPGPPPRTRLWPGSCTEGEVDADCSLVLVVLGIRLCGR